MLVAVPACGPDSNIELRREIAQLRQQLDERDGQLVAQKARIDELQRSLQSARGISDQDLQHIYYPEKLLIDGLSGGYDRDGQPGDDGVVVYLKPIDRFGDVVKAAGTVRIELFDLADGGAKVGECELSVEETAKAWYGMLMTQHYTIHCPWTTPPRNPEITVRALFTDYLTERVVTAQSVALVRLAP